LAKARGIKVHSKNPGIYRESAIAQKYQASNGDRQRPHCSRKTSINKGLYIKEYVDTGNVSQPVRSLGPRGSMRRQPFSRCPVRGVAGFIAGSILGCGNAVRKCQENAAALANFRHTITAKRGDPT
jgi:hypothetical protein